MTNPAYDILKDFGIPFITLVMGFFLGIKSTIYTDRRKEFNEIAWPIYFALKSQIDSSGHVAVDIDPDPIEPYIRWYKRWCFRDSVEKYRQSRITVINYSPGAGKVDVDEKQKSHMLICAKNVLPYLKPR